MASAARQNISRFCSLKRLRDIVLEQLKCGINISNKDAEHGETNILIVFLTDLS